MKLKKKRTKLVTGRRKMKAYGLPRTKDIEGPDAYDIGTFALKCSAGYPTEKNGDDRHSINSKVKKRIRRVWKKHARMTSKEEIRTLENEGLLATNI